MSRTPRVVTLCDHPLNCRHVCMFTESDEERYRILKQTLREGSHMSIRNPIEWSGSQLVHAAHAVRYAGNSLHHIQETIHSPVPAVRRIAIADIRDALKQGFADFEAYRTDVIFLCVIYVALGLVLARLAFGMDMLPLLFPLASGFAIIARASSSGRNDMPTA